MRVKYSKMLMGYVGKIDDKSIYFSKAHGRYIIRSIPKYKEAEHHRQFANITKQIYGLNPSEEYKADLRSYIRQYNSLPGYRERPMQSWTHAYMKLMWNMKYILGVDLATIDRELVQDLPCRTVAEAIENRMLPMVKDYQRYNAQM